MLRFVSALFAALILSATAAAPAAQFASPQALIDDIYKNRYRTKNSPGIDLGKKSDIIRYFERTLARAIDRDGRGNEPGALSGDPFTNSQDRYFSGLRIAMGSSDERAATATVSFLREADRKRSVLRYELVKAPKGWLIRDIVEIGGDAPIGHGGSLRKLLKVRP